MSLICLRMKNHFHIKGWALNLVLIQRRCGTRKRPIQNAFYGASSLLVISLVGTLGGGGGWKGEVSPGAHHFLPRSFSESCSFWYTLKDLFSLHKLMYDKFIHVWWWSPRVTFQSEDNQSTLCKGIPPLNAADHQVVKDLSKHTIDMNHN